MEEKTNSYAKKLFTGIHDEEFLAACKVKGNYLYLELKIALENIRKIERELFLCIALNF